jgi:predicted nuclease with RNAse H fold
VACASRARRLLPACGIDLAASDERTWAVVLEPSPTTTPLAARSLRPLANGRLHPELTDAANRPRVVGIDCPLGPSLRLLGLLAPTLVRRAGLDAALCRAELAASAALAHERLREEVLYRETDRRVKAEVVAPLDSNAGFLAYVTPKGAALASALSAAGVPTVMEVYPAATVAALYGGRVRYRRARRDAAGSQASAARSRIVEDLAQKTASWLSLGSVAELARRDDDVLDALLAALSALAVAAGFEHEATAPRPSDAELASIEGWIRVPSPDALERLDEALSRGRPLPQARAEAAGSRGSSRSRAASSRAS